jgi:hypothetical protein
VTCIPAARVPLRTRPNDDILEFLPIARRQIRLAVQAKSLGLGARLHFQVRGSINPLWIHCYTDMACIGRCTTLYVCRTAGAVDHQITAECFDVTDLAPTLNLEPPGSYLGSETHEPGTVWLFFSVSTGEVSQIGSPSNRVVSENEFQKQIYVSGDLIWGVCILLRV